jgi:hypothetical protein
MPKTSVSETTYTDSEGNERSQFRTTVPKGLAEAFDLGGKKLDWSVGSGNKLEVTIVDE